MPVLVVVQEGSIPACAGEPRTLCPPPMTPRVYPRVCGGTDNSKTRSNRIPGLSPRVRGNRPRCGAGRCPPGSIPACAGEPARWATWSRPGWVYPRVCGGTATPLHRLIAPKGLSPRVRGNRRWPPVPAMALWSIPACAGEPARRDQYLCGTRVYPRVCGGTRRCDGCGTALSGLSPRVRGNRAGHTIEDDAAGSIPACAGEPPEANGSRQYRWVYPRVCGGTASSIGDRGGGRGLSPRVRGNLRSSSPGGGYIGSIPACAGEPTLPNRTARAVRVYPRVCGGTRRPAPPAVPLRGLSPRVRGNPTSVGVGNCTAGSIPACAGEPAPARTSASKTTVYPRVCGGTVHLRALRRCPAGLSPRVRGNRRRLCRAPQPGGSIPACAGEPELPGAYRAGGGVYPRVCGGTTPVAAVAAANEGLSPRVRGNRTPSIPPAPPSGSIPACAGEPASAIRRRRNGRVYPRVCGGTSVWRVMM